MQQLPWWKQAWTVAAIELRRAFFSKRAFWVYGLALFPAVIFIGQGVSVNFRRARLSANGLTPAALINTVKTGESAESVVKRLGKPASDFEWHTSRRVRDQKDASGVTVHKIDPPYEARFVRLGIVTPNYRNDRQARIYEFEVYGKEGNVNLALGKPATSSPPCNANQGPEKAFNGSVKGGINDHWCSNGRGQFLQVDLGRPHQISRIVVRHASAGGEPEDLNTSMFTVQAGLDNKVFASIVNATGARLVDEITARRRVSYFDGAREARLEFTDGKLTKYGVHQLLFFEEDRNIYAGVFQLYYLRLAIFFGCLGIFMNLFRGEMLDKTLHFWFLAPARREVLLAGKYGAGLIASSIIFAAGALLCFGIMLWMHGSVEVQAYWQTAGMGHAFWYVVAAVAGCIGYGSVFLMAGLLLRNPVVPAAALLVWEGINGFLPTILQKVSVLYYLQSLCPVPAPIDESTPALLRLLLSPAAPASHASAIIGLSVLTALVLWIACAAVRRMQISYSSEN